MWAHKKQLEKARSLRGVAGSCWCCTTFLHSFMHISQTHCTAIRTVVLRLLYVQRLQVSPLLYAKLRARFINASVNCLTCRTPIPTVPHTQTWSLRTMLDAGVRALDIRLRHVNDSFTLEHGIIELPYTFDEDVRDVLASFLADNPTETVVMFYQISERGASNTRTPEASFQESLDAYPDLWITGSTVPTLDEARGKVVLPNDMPSEEQNEYELTFEAIGAKKSLIRDFFLESGPQENFFRLNFFSGTGFLVYPLTVAGGLRRFYRGTNEVVFEFTDGCLGVTMFDFIGEDAVAHIVAQQVSGIGSRRMEAAVDGGGGGGGGGGPQYFSLAVFVALVYVGRVGLGLWCKLTRLSEYLRSSSCVLFLRVESPALQWSLI